MRPPGISFDAIESSLRHQFLDKIEIKRGGREHDLTASSSILLGSNGPKLSMTFIFAAKVARPRSAK
jgi:hypothetical protein